MIHSYLHFHTWKPLGSHVKSEIPWFSMVFHGILIGNAMVFPWIFRGTSSDRCSLGSKLLGATVTVPVVIICSCHVYMIIYTCIENNTNTLTQWCSIYIYMGMDQYLLIPFLGGWTSIYQLFWCSPGVQGFDTLPYIYIHMHIIWD